MKDLWTFWTVDSGFCVKQLADYEFIYLYLSFLFSISHQTGMQSYSTALPPAYLSDTKQIRRQEIQTSVNVTWRLRFQNFAKPFKSKRPISSSLSNLGAISQTLLVRPPHRALVPMSIIRGRVKLRTAEVVKSTAN